MGESLPCLYSSSKILSVRAVLWFLSLCIASFASTKVSELEPTVASGFTSASVSWTGSTGRRFRSSSMLSPSIDCLGFGCRQDSRFSQDCDWQAFRCVVEDPNEVLHFTCLSGFVRYTFFLLGSPESCHRPF